ncbi:alpha/beta fold hydrolase [Leucobacter aridicollis]|uniref:alpha/beta fold hydrolase n=1 Tax=Leucobacter aridicollis TaxID=283878 RepID=UPI002107AA52|nr:alpha/beta hydrolase [Leucobacter aridicollis]UTX51961.1 alpha/beta hydrolase [Leucobacter aridicollis]
MVHADHTFTHGDYTMKFSSYPGPTSRTFVLIHGIGMGRIVFDEVAEVLSVQGGVLVPDLPGFGDSPEPGTEATIQDNAELIERFIASQATGDVTLVGHSMGTQIVAEVAKQFPESIDTLALIAPTINRHERSATKQAARMVQDLYGESPKVLVEGVVEYAKTSPLWFANKLRLMLDHEIENVCPDIATPTLVMRGETDHVCPRDWVQEVAAALPDSEYEEIPDRGHEAVIKSPEPVASMILEFVARRAHRSHHTS